MNLPFEPENLLPTDGTVFYYGQVMALSNADQYMERLLSEVEWKSDEAVIFGKHILPNVR